MSASTVTPWWIVEGKDCYVSIESRPTYCDRGNWIAKLFVTEAQLLTVDAQDGWPRYFFDWDRMLAEVEAWLRRRGQMP